MADPLSDAAKTFDAYEVIGIITPGAVVALMLTVEWPGFRALLGDKGFSAGDFGLFVLVAFVLGHLTQALGDIIQPVVWLPNGLPTNWLRRNRQELIEPKQHVAFLKAVKAMEEGADDLSKLDRKKWYAITSRAAGRLRAAGRSGRIDIANRTYGLSRGLTAAFLGCLVWYGLMHRDEPVRIVLLAVGLLAAVWRMRVAGMNYARALALDFIDLPAGPRQGA